MQPQQKWFLVLFLVTLAISEDSARATSALVQDGPTIGVNITAEHSLPKIEHGITVENDSSVQPEAVTGAVVLEGNSGTTEANITIRIGSEEEENDEQVRVHSHTSSIEEVEVSGKQVGIHDQTFSESQVNLEQKKVQDYLLSEDKVKEKTNNANVSDHLISEKDEDLSLKLENVYEHTSVEIEDVNVSTEEPIKSVNNQPTSTLGNDEVSTGSSEARPMDSLVNGSDIRSAKNEPSTHAEAMTSEVEVDDFMKSRVAYHNAVASDITGMGNEPSQSENEKLEALGLPEKLTMEETIGEVWKEEENNEKHGSSDGGDYDDFGHQERLDTLRAYKLTMSNQTEPEEEASETKTLLNQSYFDTPQPSLTTAMLTNYFIAENTTEYLDKSEQILSDSNEQNVTDGAEETTEVYLITHNDSDSDDGKVRNSPVAERLYAYGMNKEKDTSIFENKLEDSSENHRKASLSQSFRDYKDISEEDVIEVQNLLPDHPSFKKENIEPGVLFEECVDCDFRVLPIRPSEQRDLPKMEEEPLPSPTVRFLDLPEGRELQIYSLDLSEGFFLFGYLSEFLSWIQPNEFPVELLRDALRSQITWISLITQSLQVEAGFVACLVVGVLLALAVPMVVLSHACYRMTSRDDDDTDDKVGWAGNCRRRTLVFILQILLILLLGGMVAMFVTNEQLSDAVVKSSDVIQASLSDVSTFVQNSHLQLHFLVTQSLDQTLQAINADLDNVDTLLGRPIQRELVRETGIDVALESLVDLTREAKETTQQVDRLLDEVRVVQEMVVSTTEKLSDLRQQVELFRRACGPRDRTLCDTIDATGLEVTLQMNRLKSDERLHRMRRMGGVALEAAVTEAKARFMSVPARVEADTRDAREAARRQLMRQRMDVDDRSLPLERLVREMTGKVSEAKYQAGFWMQDLDQYEYWRWIICMGGGAAVFMVWTMLLFSLCCGCCGSEKAAGPTILVTIVLVCLLSTILWSVALVGMLFGGHGEVFVCRPLYDEPEYHMISRLVDQPGVFYSEPRGGFIANVIYGNDTLDVPIRQILEECRENHALYPTLSLGRVFDVEAAVDQNRWASVTTQLRSVRANLSSLEVLSPTLQDQLGDLLATLSVNFTEHRIQMSRPVTAKDMDSFARQLDNIGNQMRDLAVASRMETLSTRTRRLIDSHIRPLEGRKDALVYQLTALEVQTGPLQRQVNQSLSHLKTIQFFINSQGESIAQRKSRQYVDRLLNYVDQLRRHVTDAVSSSVAPCRPLWDIFNTTRLFLCRHTMDPLNGFWFASMWCLMVLLVATPVCLKLVDYYRARGARSSGSPSENLMGSEQGAAWSSPGYDIKYSKDECNGNGHCKQ